MWENLAIFQSWFMSGRPVSFFLFYCNIRGNFNYGKWNTQSTNGIKYTNIISLLDVDQHFFIQKYIYKKKPFCSRKIKFYLSFPKTNSSSHSVWIWLFFVTFVIFWLSFLSISQQKRASIITSMECHPPTEPGRPWFSADISGRRHHWKV